MTRLDAPSESVSHCADATSRTAILLDAREVPLGGIRGILVNRSLPQRQLPMVGAWCFLDRFDDDSSTMRVLPHPHTGLQTVTWPLDGDIRHRDSVGSDVVVKPGELNIMTSGHGISHSEFSLGDEPGPMHGLQLWVALPAEAADRPPAFEQHTSLPIYEGEGLRATVLIGSLGEAISPATAYTELLGADATIAPTTTTSLPVRPDFEYAILVIDGELKAEGTVLGSGPLLYLGTGRDALALSSTGGARFILLGGVPFPEELVMWWNFVARSHAEIAQARDDWESNTGRFGTVDGHDGQRIPAPPLPAVRLTPRRRRV